MSGEKFKIKQCNGCGFKITENIEDEEDIGSYYQSENYISHSNTTKGLVNSVYHQVRKYMLGRKRRLVEKAAAIQKGYILDVGTGTGFFLNEMKEYGFKLISLHTMPFDSFYVSMLSEKYKKSSLALLKGIFHGRISW